MATLLGDPPILPWEDATHRVAADPGPRGIMRLFNKHTFAIGGDTVDFWSEQVDAAVTGGGGGAVTVADGADVAEGATTDAAVVSDANGTLSGKLRGLVKLFAARIPVLGQAAMAASTPVTLASDQSALSVSTAAGRGTLTDRSGTIGAGATAQSLMASNASRKYLLIANPITATEALWFNFTATAVVGSPSIGLNAGDSFLMEGSYVSTEAISVIATTTAHAYTAKEG